LELFSFGWVPAIAAQVMGANAGLHANQARRHVGEPRFDLAA
jgi:hypothetical protein